MRIIMRGLPDETGNPREIAGSLAWRGRLPPPRATVAANHRCITGKWRHSESWARCAIFRLFAEMVVRAPRFDLRLKRVTAVHPRGARGGDIYPERQL